MKRDVAIAKLKENEDAIRALGATSLYLYGSTARDEAGPESDVDVFVEYVPHVFTLLELSGLKILFEERLGTEGRRDDAQASKSLHAEGDRTGRDQSLLMARRRRIRPALQAILENIDGIEMTLAGIRYEVYERDWAIHRSVERGDRNHLGSVAAHPDRRAQSAQPEIPWDKIIGIGNVLRHDYDDVADEILFDVATRSPEASEGRRPRHRIDPRRAAGVTAQNGRRRRPVRTAAPHFASWPVSRVLYGGFAPRDGHSSRTAVAGGLRLPTRAVVRKQT